MPSPLVCFEQFFEVFQVVAGNKNRFAFHRCDAHAGRHRIAVGAGVGGIEHFHDRQVDFAAFHVQGEKLVHRRIRLSQVIQRFMDECIDFVILLAQHVGMIRIGGNALQSVGQQFLKTGQIVSQGGPGLTRCRYGLPVPAALPGGRRSPLGRPFEFFRLLAGAAAGFLIQRPARSFLIRRRFANHVFNAGGVEVHIGHRCEQGFHDKYIRLMDSSRPVGALWFAYWLMPFAA